jgi:SAM-dependent methyltransferase
MFNDPALYHLHHSHEKEDTFFWNRLAGRYGGPILELGCGTGRILIPLAEAGYSITGLDINFQALVYLKNSLNIVLREQISVFQSNMDRFHLGKDFSLIFLACNTWSTLDSETRLATLNKIANHLNPAGIFATSFPNPAYLEDLPDAGEMEIEETLIHPITGNPVQVMSGWERTENRMTFRWYYDQLFPDGNVVREKNDTQHFLTSLDEYIAEMKAEKLNPIEVLGDYSFSDYKVTSPYSIIIARKEF